MDGPQERDRLYERDAVRWAAEQADALRQRDHARLDYENLAEEIESLAIAERRSLASYIRVVLLHLMKLQASPATDLRRGWKASIIQARADIRHLLRYSPSLHGVVGELVEAETPDIQDVAGRVLAVYREMPRVPLDTLAYDAEQVLGDWLPADDTD